MNLRNRIIFLIIMLPMLIFGATTGKIAGTVTDETTGEPLAGANVIVEGTSLGAAADMNGYYSILNIPPGKYTVRVSMIGYQTIVQKEVTVMVDLTTTLNFSLSPQTLQGEEVVVIAHAPIVQKDVTSTSFKVGADQIDQLQVVDMNEIIELQAGVINGHFRGGRSGEVMYIVDGIPMNDAYSGSAPFQVENEIVQEVEVISGTFNAEYGQAMSGIVNIVTKEGQDHYAGKISFFGGDYVSDKTDIFMHIDDINPLAVNNSQFNFSGPVPFFGDRLSFSILGRLNNTDGWMYGQRLFMPKDSSDFSGEDPYIEATGDKKYVSMNASQKITLQGKLTLKVFEKDKLNYSGFYTDRNFSEFDRLFKYNPEGNYDRDSYSLQNSLQYTRSLSAGTFLTVNLSRSNTEYGQYVYKDEHDPRYVPIHLLNGTGSNGFSTGGMRMWHHHRDNITDIAKMNLTSQVNKINKVGAGISYKKSNLSLHEFQIYFDEKDQLQIPPDSSWYNNSYNHKPEEIAIYIQDKIEVGDMIINAGLRYDYFNPDGEVPEQFYNTRDAEKKPAEKSSQLSPRFGIAYPITDRGVIHFSYGHFFQVPNYEYLYINPDFEVSLIQIQGDQPPRGSFNSMGNAELKPEKTVSYEIGIKQALTDRMSIDVTMYNKDIRDLIGQETRTDLFGGKYWRYINRDYANVKGITLAFELLETAYTPGFSIDYTYQSAKGNASSPGDEWINQQQDPPVQTEKKLRPLDWDQTHSLNFYTTYSIKGFRMSLIGKFGSGTPYTRASARYSNRILNGERKPSTVIFDFNLAKDYHINALIISPFLKIYNIMDRENCREVYSSSGRPDYDFDMNFQSYTGIKTQEEFFVRPDFYYEPRKIILGFSVAFDQKR
ncbi:MAG: TonB-dependent receptor [Fidelibacterota bacterium]